MIMQNETPWYSILQNQYGRHEDLHEFVLKLVSLVTWRSNISRTQTVSTGGPIKVILAWYRTDLLFVTAWYPRATVVSTTRMLSSAGITLTCTSTLQRFKQFLQQVSAVIAWIIAPKASEDKSSRFSPLHNQDYGISLSVVCPANDLHYFPPINLGSQCGGVLNGREHTKNLLYRISSGAERKLVSLPRRWN